MIMPAVVFCIAGWEELQTASYKFRGCQRSRRYTLERSSSQPGSRKC